MQHNFWDLTSELKRENKAMKNGCPSGNLAMRQLTSVLKVSTLIFTQFTIWLYQDEISMEHTEFHV